jgi:hypothetical protein
VKQTEGQRNLRLSVAALTLTVMPMLARSRHCNSDGASTNALDRSTGAFGLLTLASRPSGNITGND